MEDDPKPDRPADEGVDLWAVSYADDDDRELTSSQIAGAIERGEINAQTIVWRPGMENWQPLSERPELAPLLPRSEPPSAPPAPKISQPPLVVVPEEFAAPSAPRFRAHVALGAVLVAGVLLIVVWSSTRSSRPIVAEASVPAAPAVPASTSAASSAPAATAEPVAAPASVAPPADAPDYFAFDRLRAMRQLAAIAEKAARCRGRGTPAGTVRVMVTFEPSGGAPSSVSVTQAPYAGTPTATCVAKKLATASAPPFRGPAVTLRVPVELR